jgi:hypothetical protein
MKSALRIAVLFFASATVSQAQDLRLYGGGTVSFDFRQFPFGPLAGSFRCQGQIFDPATFPPGSPGAAAGFIGQTDPGSMMGVVGGFLNVDPQRSADLMFLVLKNVDPIVPGRYGFEPQNQDISVGFVNNGRSLELPNTFSELVTFDWRDWFLRIEADHRFIGVYGTITIKEVREDTLTGTFDGLMMEVESGTLISVSSGQFNLGRTLVSVDEMTWGVVKGLYRD